MMLSNNQHHPGVHLYASKLACVAPNDKKGVREGIKTVNNVSLSGGSRNKITTKIFTNSDFRPHP